MRGHSSRHTRKFFVTHTGHNAQSLARDYRCLYCRKYFISVADLTVHEERCDLREVREMDWANHRRRWEARQST